FAAEGYHAAVLHSLHSSAERETILADFAAGRIQILCNVNILTEGYDLPAIECVILNRKTQSIPLYMQMVGRGLRPADGKTDLVVIDHGNNVLTLDKVEAPRQWSLDGRIKGEKEGVAPVKTCPECEFMLHT
ncbi:helicase-related protein, partial [Arthrospira platensis SPKY1]|nr:helicase-related protein [Arthrospira platensis SPKY1]